MSQSELIEKHLLNAMDDFPHKNKSDIMTIVADQLDVKRSTVRRVKAELLDKLNKYVEILADETTEESN